MRDPQSEQRKPLLRDCNKPLVKNDISWTDGKMTPIVILRIQVSLKNFTRNNVLWQMVCKRAIMLLFKRILVIICFKPLNLTEKMTNHQLRFIPLSEKEIWQRLQMRRNCANAARPISLKNRDSNPIQGTPDQKPTKMKTEPRKPKPSPIAWQMSLNR